MRKPVLFITAAALVGAALVAVHGARAQSSTTTAFLGGLQSDKTSAPELVVFNTTGSPLALDVRLRSPTGAQLAVHAAVAVDPQATRTLDLKAELIHAGTNGKAYSGIFSVEVSGEAPFGENAVVVHVTQYFGSRKKPKAGFVVRPIFSPAP